MGIRRVKSNYEVRKRWPDGSEFRRFFPNKTVAKRTLDRIAGSIAEGTWRQLKLELTLRSKPEEETFESFSRRFIEEYAKPRLAESSWKRYELSLESLNAVLGGIPLSDFHRHDLHKYVQRRVEEVTPATVNRDIACAKKMFSFAFEIGMIDTHPLSRFPLLKEPEKSRTILTVDEFHIVVEAMPTTVMQAYTALIGETGLRRNEGLDLEWPQIDLKERLVLPEKTKNRKSRIVPLSDYTIPWLSKLVRHISCPRVFINPRTVEPLKWPDKTFRKYAAEAGFPGLGFHDLRCFRATTWARTGVDLKTIQKMLGHADIRTTMKYVRYVDSALDDVRAAQQRELTG